MVKPGMRCVNENSIGKAKLVQIVEPLKGRRMQQIEFRCFQFLVVVQNCADAPVLAHCRISWVETGLLYGSSKVKEISPVLKRLARQK